MARTPHCCVTISACLAGALLLLPLCLGDKDDHYDYDSTHSPEYFDNVTFEYSFFSNASSDELERFLFGEETGGETSTTATERDGSTTATERDRSVLEEKPMEPTISVMSQASRSVPVCFLFTLVPMVHELLRL